MNTRNSETDTWCVKPDGGLAHVGVLDSVITEALAGNFLYYSITTTGSLVVQAGSVRMS